MAVTPTAPTTSATEGRRFTIGANVVIAIIAAAALLAAVNYISSIKYYRRDLASVGNYGLSDRTKSVLREYKEPIKVSMLYMPDEANDKQQGYIQRLQEYCDELQRFAPNVTATHIATDSQREKLVADISGTFGSEADKHKAALAEFETLRAQLLSDLQSRLELTQAVLSEETWLADFPIFASIVATLRADVESLNKTAEAIKEFTPAGGIPKYGEATTKAKEALTEVKGHLEAVQKRLGELALLAEETGKPDSKYIVMLRDVAREARSTVDSLRTIVGKPNDPPATDPSALLKAFADRGSQVHDALEKLMRRVDEFARRFPMVSQHPNWAANAQMGPITTRMEVADVLRQAGQTLASTRLVILGIIDSGNAQELAKAVEDVRRNCAILEQNASISEKLLTGLADELSQVDPKSKELLDSAKGGTLLKDKIEAIAALQKTLDGLPELKLGSVADQLKKDNSVVIQTGGKIRVVEFGEVFPVRESAAANSGKDDEAPRVFNGDSAISSAILAMTREKPFGTVVLTCFEPPAPQQRNQFMPPPPQSWVPLAQMTQVRQRLEGANFKVVDWNMATTPDAPPPEEGTQAIYLLLPPPPAQSASPFGPPPGEDQTFGDAHRAKIKKLLDEDARMIFLATWEVRSSGMFGGPPMTPPFAYDSLLEGEWGIAVDTSRRITWVEPDRKRADSFKVSPRQFIHMPVVGFTDEPIGRQLRGTRFLITDACPIGVSKTQPAGISVASILKIPNSENYVAPTIDDLVKIIDRVQDPTSQGIITMTPPPPGGPFDIALAAERTADGKSKGKLVVIGFGASYRSDYLEQPVLASGDTLRLEPAPTESVDLLVNSMYWLIEKPQYIARGPVPVPRVEPIEPTQQQVLRVFVWAVWPVIVFIPGIVLWYTRRR